MGKFNDKKHRSVEKSVTITNKNIAEKAGGNKNEFNRN